MTRDTAVLVVDDARFSVAVIARTLRTGGFNDVRFATNAAQALQIAEQRPADVLIADWLMPEASGLVLTRQIRDLDRMRSHYTYVILLSAEERPEAMQDAFDADIDDFVNKGEVRTQLLPRLLAAARLAARQNHLLETNARLASRLRRIEGSLVIDPLTGLGNARHALAAVRDTLRAVESRGGAVCVLRVALTNCDDIARQHGEGTAASLVQAFAARLRQLVRPLDAVSHVAQDEFTVTMHQPTLEHCDAGNFQRIYQGLHERSLRTESGFLRVRIRMSLSACDRASGLMSAEELLQATESREANAVPGA